MFLNKDLPNDTQNGAECDNRNVTFMSYFSTEKIGNLIKTHNIL